MCGLLGLDLSGSAGREVAQTAYNATLELGVRGLHSSGVAWDSPLGVRVERSHHLLDTAELVQRLLLGGVRRLIVHTRYSTSGDWKKLENAQPILRGERALAFNGVLHMGTKAEVEAHYDVKLDADNDGEVLLAKIEEGWDAGEWIATQPGSFAGLILQKGEVRALRNARRPLWEVSLPNGKLWISTEDAWARAASQSLQGLPKLSLPPV